MAHLTYQRIVVGYHGCDAAVAASVLAGRARLHLTNRKNIKRTPEPAARSTPVPRREFASASDNACPDQGIKTFLRTQLLVVPQGTLMCGE
jgi:hypothetical protein